MIIKHVWDVDESFFESTVQEVVNEVLGEPGCHRKLVDIKYSTVGRKNPYVEKEMMESDAEIDDEHLYYTSYSALLIFE